MINTLVKEKKTFQSNTLDHCHNDSAATADDDVVYYYEVSGKAAHDRIAPLLPSHWVDVTETTKNTTLSSSETTAKRPDFLWENSPKYHTKAYRDSVTCYSHLPNGISILDDKWKLAKLPPHPSLLESHCFIGPSGFQSFWERQTKKQTSNILTKQKQRNRSLCPDLLPNYNADYTGSNNILGHSKSSNGTSNDDGAEKGGDEEHGDVWVIKDSNANGAGGIWIVDKHNADELFADHDDNNKSSNKNCLIENHRYVAQRYGWPLALYGGRKCHFRVYVLFTHDGRAYVHNQAFLHVANQPFSPPTTSTIKNKKNNNEYYYDQEVHITNCCANSHDDSKFTGEICASLTGDCDGISLKQYEDSIYQCVAHVAKHLFPFLQGGLANYGFEYCGFDFLPTNNNYNGEMNKNNVFLLEINAPPSQDTATGLTHAEQLHNNVIKDILDYFVIPHIDRNPTKTNNNNYMNHDNRKKGGWMCVYSKEEPPSNDNMNIHNNDECYNSNKDENPIVPSKAAILNKLRWVLYERKYDKQQKQKQQQQHRINIQTNELSGDINNNNNNNNNNDYRIKLVNNDVLQNQCNWISNYARLQFPYFLQPKNKKKIFLESAGGAQVPQLVIQCMSQSLSDRHRSIKGTLDKEKARLSILQLLGANPQTHSIIFGTNATTLLHQLAFQYYHRQQHLFQSSEDDEALEIIISTENHLANVTPWLNLASSSSNVKVIWWSPSLSSSSTQTELLDLVTENTRIVAISHCSNVLGYVHNLKFICDQVHQISKSKAHVIVDGVAASPHIYANMSQTGVDWYVISCHKLFGPHIGALCGRRHHHFPHTTTNNKYDSAPMNDRTNTTNNNDVIALLEMGTMNYEACSGIQGILQYFQNLANIQIVSNNGNTLEDDYFNNVSTTQYSYNGNKDQHVSDNIYDSNSQYVTSPDNVFSTLTTGESTVQEQHEHQQLLPSSIHPKFEDKNNTFDLSAATKLMRKAYEHISIVEMNILNYVLPRLEKCHNVRVLQKKNDYENNYDLPDKKVAVNQCSGFGDTKRIPIISFIHEKIPSQIIVGMCYDHGIICRHGTFLTTERFLNEYGIDPNEGFVRLSFAHYNTLAEAISAINFLESMDGWN